MVNKKSRTYSIESVIKNDNIQQYENHDKILVKKYIKMFRLTQEQKAKYKHIDSDIMEAVFKNLSKLTINKESALKELECYDIERIKKAKNKNSIESISCNNIWFKFDNYGRFHSNFTTLKSSIRDKYVKIDGEEIIEFDIINSQPIFLTLLMGNKKEMLDNTHEFDYFKKLVLSGKLYDYISANYFKMFDIQLNKTKTKKLVFNVLFGKNFKNKNNILFKSIFPTIYKFIIKYKEINNNYKSLAYKLQRMESDFLFNRIIRQLLMKDENIAFFTVHDSIMCKKSDKDKIEYIFYKNIEHLHSKL